METAQEIAEKPARELPACPVETTLMLISDKWKVLILRDLMPGTKRFSELKRSVGHVTQKVLTAQLRQMEESGLVARTVYPEVTPRVEYSLTELGRSLKPVLDAMWDWGENYKSKNALLCSFFLFLSSAAHPLQPLPAIVGQKNKQSHDPDVFRKKERHRPEPFSHHAENHIPVKPQMERHQHIHPKHAHNVRDAPQGNASAYGQKREDLPG